jgi:hypothetical protein
MADYTDVAEERSLDWLWTTGSPTRPTAWYVGLFTTTPTADAGTGGVECSNAGYARQAVTWVRTGSVMNPNATVTFGPATENWTECVGFGVWDALSGGNMLAFKDLNTPRTLSNGDSAEFATSDLSITLD